MAEVYRLIEDDPRMGLTVGDVLVCIDCDYDPDKVTVIRRLSDGYDPECTVYLSDVDPMNDHELAVWSYEQHELTTEGDQQ